MTDATQDTTAAAMTIADFCAMIGKKPNTVRMAWRKAGLSDFAQRRAITDEEQRAMLAYYVQDEDAKFLRRAMPIEQRAKLAQSVGLHPAQQDAQSDDETRNGAKDQTQSHETPQAERSTEPATTTQPMEDNATRGKLEATTANTADWMLTAINYTEMSIAGFGFWLLFGWLGLPVALVCVLFYAHAQSVMLRANSYNAAPFALLVCVCLACVFAWVHGQTLHFALRATRPDMDAQSMFWVCVAGAGILSIISLAALYQQLQSKLDSNEQQ